MSSSQKGHIFISYRRADSEGYAGRIYDRITPHFGAEAVFMDVDTIDAGVDFVKVLEAAVQSCDVLVALIGRRWLNLKDENGARRLDNPEDFVRVEIATALERDIRVIPVLVGGASMPGSTELPENLQTLARRNALTVNHATFHADMSRLIEHLERALQAAEDSKILKAKKLQEEQVRNERQTQVEKLLHQADTAINLNDWELAGEKLKEILAIDPGHLEAQAKLELVEEKEKTERSEKEEARKRKVKWEQEAAAKTQAERLAREKTAAEEKARRAALRKEHQQEIIKRYKKYFANLGKLPYFIGGGIVLLFALGYIISNIEFPAKPEPTKTPTALVLPTATFSLPTSTSLPTLTSRPASTATLTEIPPTPTPSLDVGSTMVSEKDSMVMVYVPAGEFQMGSENGESDEKPVHIVYLDAFWIDQTEVTNAMYAKCVEAGACYPPRSTASDTRNSYYGNPEFDDYPVIWVDWGYAKAYCEWADRNLPSEAEWEKAARGGLEEKAYPWGDEPPVCEYGAENGANFYDCNNTDTESVGSYAPNGYGVYDMAGNVVEWISSLYKPYPYNAMDGREALSASDYRMKRGGSWGYSANGLRSAYRINVHRSNAAYQGTGFRCARSVE